MSAWGRWWSPAGSCGEWGCAVGDGSRDKQLGQQAAIAVGSLAVLGHGNRWLATGSMAAAIHLLCGDAHGRLSSLAAAVHTWCHLQLCCLSPQLQLRDISQTFPEQHTV
jgi:hypothetical protein